MMRPILEITEVTTELVVGEPVVQLLTVGIQGPSGAVAENVKYVHSQPSASAEWIVNHNLGVKPTAEVISVGGEVVEAEVLHVSNNQLRVYFSAAFTGSVRCI